MKSSDFEYHSHLPYPQVIIDAPSKTEALCIVEDYAGKGSEFTAISEYLYQSFILHTEYPEYSLALRKIAEVEMHHLLLLGETLPKLGADPVIGGRNCYWNGSFVDYTKNIEQFLMHDIKSEIFAIEGYRNSIFCVKNSSIKALLERIILDEDMHIHILNQLLESLRNH